MIILRQKQYSPGFSGIKQVLKKNIDSARMKLAEKLDKSIEKDLIEKKKLETEGFVLSRNLRSKLEPGSTEKEIERIKASENKIGFKRDEGLGTSLDRTKIILPEGKEVSKGELYHELGHIKNYRGENGRLAKYAAEHGQTKEMLDGLSNIDVISKNPSLALKKNREPLKNIDPPEYENIENFFGTAKLKDLINRTYRGGLLNIDEQKASKWGLKKIKNEVSPDIWELEKQRQDVANETYKKSISVSRKIPLRNMIQVPERRGDFNFKNL